MKMKGLPVFASAAAMPFAAAFAQNAEPGGSTLPRQGRMPYSGFSADTNPPVPAP